jgi:DNA-binding transcriptional MerR regulator
MRGRFGMSAREPGGDLTIDELAARVGMTVRNVRAYASRGLMPAPRLVGRTGYYSEEHVQRLLLVRELIERGYTLAAVERALTTRGQGLAGHALDLLAVLDDPLREAEPSQEMTRDGLAAMAGVGRDAAIVQALLNIGLVKQIDEDRLLVLQPSVVRAGAQAIALGLEPHTVIALLPLLSHHLRAVADAFVTEVRSQIWHPFAEEGMPEEGWADVLEAVQTLMPVAGQAVLAIFRNELAAAIKDALGEELNLVAGDQP